VNLKLLPVVQSTSFSGMVVRSYKDLSRAERAFRSLRVPVDREH
jgi:hypothetical protein